MKKTSALVLCALPLAFLSAAHAQQPAAPGTTEPHMSATTPGSSTPVPSGAMATATSEISVKDDILGKSVVNETDEKVGDINDIVIAADGRSMHYIVGAGGFLGLGEHTVSIPGDRINRSGDKLVMQGYTKEQLKALPAYKRVR